MEEDITILSEKEHVLLFLQMDRFLPLLDTDSINIKKEFLHWSELMELVQTVQNCVSSKILFIQMLMLGTLSAGIIKNQCSKQVGLGISVKLLQQHLIEPGQYHSIHLSKLVSMLKQI